MAIRAGPAEGVGRDEEEAVLLAGEGPVVVLLERLALRVHGQRLEEVAAAAAGGRDEPVERGRRRRVLLELLLAALDGLERLLVLGLVDLERAARPEGRRVARDLRGVDAERLRDGAVVLAAEARHAAVPVAEALLVPGREARREERGLLRLELGVEHARAARDRVRVAVVGDVERAVLLLLEGAEFAEAVAVAEHVRVELGQPPRGRDDAAARLALGLGLEGALEGLDVVETAGPVALREGVGVGLGRGDEGLLVRLRPVALVAVVDALEGLHVAVAVELEVEHVALVRLGELLVEERRALRAARDDRVDVVVRDVVRVAGPEDRGRPKGHGLEHLVLGRALELLLRVVEAALLDDHRVELELLLRALDDLLLDRVRGHEAVDVDGLLLADAVGPVHGLQVRLGVPVRVVEHDRVRGLQVDAEAARARRQQEDELVAVRRVVGLDEVVALLVGRVAVDAAVLVVAHGHEVLEDVEERRHLAEDEDAVAAVLELREELVEEHELAAVGDDVVA